MTPLEFKSAWTSERALIAFELVQFPRESVSTLAIPSADRDFLTDIGLPKEAAPMLVFGSKRELSLPTAGHLLGMNASFSYLRVVGFNNYGDPICIDESNGGKIVYLFHDGPAECRFINSSIPQLAYSLLAFREAVKTTNAIGGRGAFSKGLIPPEVTREFVRNIDDIDPAAIQPDQFWFKEIHP
jgi:SUKH-4 immunity protein